MEAEITATRGKPRGLVRLNVGTAYAKHCLMPSLAGFHARYPDIEIELSIDDRHVDIIGQQIDVAVRTGALGNSTLITRKLGEADRIICASRAYLRRHGKPKSPKDLARHSCLRMTAAGRLAEWWMRTEDGLAPFKVKGWITCDSVDIMFDMVRQGMGIARLEFSRARRSQIGRAGGADVRPPRCCAVSNHRADAARPAASAARPRAGRSSGGAFRVT